MREGTGLGKSVLGSAAMQPRPDPVPAAGPARRIADLADQCVKCGLCLPHCPTYRAGREEGESPRGRIALARALALGELEPTPRALGHLDRCLACRACERACPPGVRFADLLVETRTLLATRRGLPSTVRRLRWLLLRPRMLERALDLLRLLRSSGLARIVQALGLDPGPDSVPTPPPRLHFAFAGPGTRGEVTLFLGCVARRYDAAAHAAAIRLLTAAGYRVRVPDAQGCCGAALAHAGDRTGAQTLTAALARDLAGEGPVLVSASGCLGAVRAALGARVHEIHTFLAADAGVAALRFRRADETLALHLPCTLRYHDGGRAALDLLGRIPGLQLARLPEQARCCGAAGIQFLAQPSQARALRAELLGDIAAAASTQVATANVGCRLWIEAGLSTTASPPRLYHSLELLARQLDCA
jgi:glycolate oxidase iron-sulfur subunit